MKICLCNNVTSGDVKRLIDKGFSKEEIMDRHFQILQCGACVDVMEQYIDTFIELHESDEKERF